MGAGEQINRENSEQLAWGLVNKQMKCFQLAPTEGGGGGGGTNHNAL